MLAAEVVPLLARTGCRLALFDLKPGVKDGFDIAALDITNPSQVDECLSSVRPAVIYNLAAYTAVDAAEKDYRAAFAVNGAAPGNLARLAVKLDSLLVHISTDYVFGGDPELSRNPQPIAEDHLLLPCGIYGESKRMGEELVRAIAPAHSLIVRTSWLHGVHGPNFVDTIRRVLLERDRTDDLTPLRVVSDQIGSPTWCGWLAQVLVDLVEKKARGTFHAASRGNISWFDFATAIAKSEDSRVPVNPQTSVELNRPAPRPSFSTLDVRKLEAFLGRPCPSWQEGLEEHLRRRRGEAHV